MTSCSSRGKKSIEVGNKEFPKGDFLLPHWADLFSPLLATSLSLLLFRFFLLVTNYSARVAFLFARPHFRKYKKERKSWKRCVGMYWRIVSMIKNDITAFFRSWWKKRVSCSTDILLNRNDSDFGSVVSRIWIRRHLSFHSWWHFFQKLI